MLGQEKNLMVIKVSFTHKKILNIYIVDEINLRPYRYDDYPTLGNSLFGAVKLTKNTDIDQCKYSDYGIGFDTCKNVSLSDGSGFGKNVIIFVADMSSYVHVDNW